jgi:hypothetical protein
MAVEYELWVSMMGMAVTKGSLHLEIDDPNFSRWQES